MWKRNFSQFIEAAASKIWKDISKQLELAKQMILCDPRPIALLPLEITAFPLIIPRQSFSDILDSVKWRSYRDYAILDSPRFDVIEWWIGMKDKLPTMYPFLQRLLVISATSCNVEAHS